LVLLFVLLRRGANLLHQADYRIAAPLQNKKENLGGGLGL
jgi:hypothetical protein